MPMNKEQWKAVQESLLYLYGAAELDCDGYQLSLIKAQYGESKIVILFYVDGVVKVKWFLDDCEERRRFSRPITKHVFPKKSRDQVVKSLGKKHEMSKQIQKTFTSYRHYWTSFSALKSHLLKNNQNIDLVDCSAARRLASEQQLKDARY